MKRDLSFLLLLFVPFLAHSKEPDLYGNSVRMPTAGLHGIVVCDDREAAEWGAEVLRKGGNAVDAAVATAFAMSVTRPHFAALGGGGFMVFCQAPVNGQKKDCTTLDFREQAPKAATRDMYLRNGKGDTSLSQDGALASGVPGNVAGWLEAQKKFGRSTRPMLLSKPISLAETGIRVSTHTERAAIDRWPEMNVAARAIFGCGKPQPCQVGAQLRQKDLAAVLRRISSKGADGFYRGSVATMIARGIQSAGGVLTTADLASYRPVSRKPVTRVIKGQEVISMPPPSSGGIALLQMLSFMEMAEKNGLLKSGPGSSLSDHVEAHAMSLAFSDRAEHLGDPDFYSVPAQGLLNDDYLASRWKTFDQSHAKVDGSAGNPPQEPSHTTHLSVIDRDGNAVAMTITVNDNFGSGFVPPGTGIVMNNQMDDFSIQPGVPNLFGLVGGEANSVHASKRPLSSMSPTIVRDANGNVRIAIGAAGGPKIITAVFQSLVNRLFFDEPLVDAVASPRIHQQWKPKSLKLERKSIPQDVRGKLVTLGYTLEDMDRGGVVHAAERLPNGRVVGVPDPRGEGAAVAE